MKKPTTIEGYELTGEVSAHIFIPYEKEQATKEALHTALTKAGYKSLPADPQQAHITDYLERVFGAARERAGGWLISAISLNDYKVLTQHVTPALCGLAELIFKKAGIDCGLAELMPGEEDSIAEPYIAFEIDLGIWEFWEMTSGGVKREIA